MTDAAALVVVREVLGGLVMDSELDAALANAQAANLK